MCAPCCGGTGSQPAALRLTPTSSKLTPTSLNNPCAAPIPHLTPPGHDNAWVTRQKGHSIWQRPAGVNWTPEGREGGWERSERGWGGRYQRAHLRPQLRFPPFIVFGMAASWCAREAHSTRAHKHACDGLCFDCNGLRRGPAVAADGHKLT